MRIIRVRVYTGDSFLLALVGNAAFSGTRDRQKLARDGGK